MIQDKNTNGRESDVFVPRTKKVSNSKSRLAQIIATAAFGTMVFSVGSLLTAPTIIVGALNKNETTPPDFQSNETMQLNSTNEFEEMQLSNEQASWIGSVMYIVQPFGSIVSGFIQGHIGRRNGMIATTIVQLIGWISLYFCTNITSLFCAAILMGLSIGFMEAPGLSFLGEVIEPRYRGSFANIAMNMWLFGVLLIYLFGAVLSSWRHVCLASAAVPTINFIMLCLIPESPVFLLLQGKERQAEAALRWLRGWADHEAIRDEYEALVESLAIPRKHSGAYLTPTAQHGVKESRKPEKSQLAMLCERRVFFPIFLLALLFFTQHCVALAGLKPFMVPIFESLNMQLGAHWILVFSGVLQLVGMAICAIAIRYTGKKLMMVISGAGSAFICFLLAIYTYILPDYPVIPMILFGINFLANGLGIMSIPWILISEVFPTECRGSAAGIGAASSYILGFIVTKTYKELESAVSLWGCLLIYSVVGLSGTLYAYFKLPETEGKTLTEIQELFKSKSERNVMTPPKGHYY